MKILFTSHKFSPDVGGIEVNSEILAEYFSTKGHEVRLMTQTKSKDCKKRCYKVYRKPPIWTVLRLYAWSEIVYQNNIELGSLWPNIIFRKPYVISVRTWIRNTFGKKRARDYLKKLVLSFAASVISVSEAIKKDSHENSVVIGNPYRSKLFRKIDEVKRNESVVYLGRFVSDKGIEMLIKAYSEVNHKSIPLTLIGSGPDEKKYIELAKQVNISLRITGNLNGEELVKELNSHKILVIPSIWEEPFGNVALEGMACGCLVLAADGGGLPDAIGNAGLTFKRGSVEDLVDKMKILINNHDTQLKIRESVKSHLSNHLEQIVCKKYLMILEKAYNIRRSKSMSFYN